MFLINSRSHLVSAALLSSWSKSNHQKGRTFSRSYGTILPSSFTRVLSSALVFSTCLPVSVCGTVPNNLKLRGFSWKLGINDFLLTVVNKPHHTSAFNSQPDLPSQPAYMLVLSKPKLSSFSLLRPPIAVIKSSGILT